MTKYVRLNLYVDGRSQPAETLRVPVGESYEGGIHSSDVRIEIVGVVESDD